MPKEKEHINVAFIGHVDHGKSTTIGRLLYEVGEVPEHIIEKYKKEAQEKGKATFEFAWVMDRLKEERERGLTIDVAHRKFRNGQILHNDRRLSGTQRLHQEHDNWRFASRCGSSSHGCS